MIGVWSFISGLLLGLMGFINPATFGLAEAFGSLPNLLVVCLLNIALVVWFVHNTNLTGKKLGLVVFIIIFGVMFFMTQIETIYFNDVIQIPWQIIMSTVLTGVGVGLVVAWQSVQYQSKVLGKSSQPGNRATRGVKQKRLTVKFVILALIYLIFYFVFGYYIAWQFPALREYYSGTTDILPFVNHMQEQVRTDAGLIVFQIVRGFLWAGIGYAVATSTKEKNNWERVVIVGLALSVGLATLLFVPNEYMPGAVRFGHFFELLIENFLFGVLCAIMFKSNISSTLKQ